MGKLYKRVGEPAKKECDNCNTVWDDKNLFNDQHQYGTTNCPFCHTLWEATEIIKLSKPVLRKTTLVKKVKELAQLKQSLVELQSKIFTLEGGTAMDCGAESDDNIVDYSTKKREHGADLKNLAGKHYEQPSLIGRISILEREIANETPYREPEGIRLKNGQMDWDVAYANLRAYRDKI